MSEQSNSKSNPSQSNGVSSTSSSAATARASSSKNSKRRNVESFADFSMVKLRHWFPVKNTHASLTDVCMG